MSSCLMQADLLVSVHTYEKISNVVAWKRHIKYFVDKVTYFAFNPSGHIRSTLLSSWHWTFIIESKNMIEKDFIIAPDRWKFSTQLKMILKKKFGQRTFVPFPSDNYSWLLLLFVNRIPIEKSIVHHVLFCQFLTLYPRRLQLSYFI